MSEQYTIESTEQLAERIRAAAEQQVPVYPVGGGTSLNFGLPMKAPGWSVDLTGLNQVIDYPAADMTITVQAGMRMNDLARILAAHQQQLPLDVPQADRATVGGVLATNFSGHRRLGYGTARDYVIGIRAIDGRGESFAGGGRVVKNVAGYDFCKLLIGSLGTLGIISEVTFKLRPLASQCAALMVAPQSLNQLDELLARLVDSQTQPIAAEWLVGPAWYPLAQAQQWPSATTEAGWLVLLVEGLPAEVDWMQAQLKREWQDVAGLCWHSLAGPQVELLQRELREFPAAVDAPLVLKGTMLPSQVTTFGESIRRIDSQATLQAHAASGVVRARLSEYPATGFGKTLTGTWQPLAQRSGGNVILLSNRDGQEMTSRAMWGVPSGPVDVMRRIKQQFDPHQILNPGRFVYGTL